MSRDTVLQRRTFEPGQKLFKQGEEGNNAFVLQSGEVDIVLNADSDNEVILATVGPGGIIGEMALMDDNPRGATARARSGGALIIVSRQMFEAKMKKADPFLRGLLNIMVDHVRRMTAEKSNS